MTQENTIEQTDLAQEITQAEKVCYRHPETETGLRCARCERYICPKCAQRTPVGYICPECQRTQENKFFTGGTGDYGVAAIIATPLSLVAAFVFAVLLSRIGFFALWFALPGGPFAGGLIAEAVRWGVSKRRSRYLGRVVAACLIGVSLIFAIISLLIGNMFGLLTLGILVVTGSGTILARLR